MRSTLLPCVVVLAVFSWAVKSLADESKLVPTPAPRVVAAHSPAPRVSNDLTRGLPCACIQQLWVDYPGPYDLYFVLVYVENCEEPGEEDLWYGEPSNAERPQVCEENTCENFDVKRTGVGGLPGHGHALTGADAWKTVQQGLQAAKKKTPKLEYGVPQYHKIPQEKLPEGLEMTEDLCILAVPITVHVAGSSADGRVYYLCFQLDSIGDAKFTEATFGDAKLGSGEQLHVPYQVEGKSRTGLVWLRGRKH